ncbi:phage major capsid protein [Sphingorhabdus soli]|uniref:Phage major capsid protein n=1 Tax=Flavisphingopyxis soli TaxID=2601267 RepID=A0A5C6UM44_9SPHN|nr:phage major capsid protein [Sphingorhabdus soli]TXC73959.1 phage major capsid protein [Sphingorhabdus soli]
MKHLSYMIIAIIAVAAMIFTPDVAMAATGAAAVGGLGFKSLAMAGLALPAAREFGRKNDGGDASPTTEADLKTAADTLKKATDDVKEFATRAEARLKAGEDLSKEAKAAADKLLTEVEAIRATHDALEQKLSRSPGTPERQKSYGEQIVGSDEYKAMKSGGSGGRMKLLMKAITSASTDVEPMRDRETVQMPRRGLFVRDLLDVVPTSSSSIDYMRQSVRDNQSAPVAESAAKPYSNYAWEKVSVAVRTIAHLAKLTRQAVDDDVQLQGEVDSEMRFGLRLTEEAQLLFGDNTGENLNGLVPQATAYADPTGGAITAETQIDTLRLAALQAELSLYPSDGFVLNPIDWAIIELTKTTEGAYIFANPTGLAGPTLWGKPVVATPAMTEDKFLSGGFKRQRLYDRMDIEVLIASENADDFEKNMYTMRAEERLALAARTPAALIYGDFGRIV